MVGPKGGWDLAIIGGGIVGLASARELLIRHPELRLVVLEKEDGIARHQSGHNSGVIHSGIYYAPGSLKAKACVAGKEKLLRFCDERGITYDLCGKVIVALDEEELPRLETLYQRGLANGVPGLELIGPERLREIEPDAVGIKALYSPATGIIDFTQVARAYADDVEARYVISCAGLYSDRVATMTGAPPTPKIVPFRGDYYLLHPEKGDRLRGMIYPVPDPRFPFLGVHFTRRLNGEVWLGPNAVLAFAREGYGWLTTSPGDLLESLAYSGFRSLALKYWRTGLAEMYRDYSKGAFLRELQRYMPDLTMDDLLPGPSGVRAQALAEDGTLVDDFVVNHNGNALHVRNAPSPAATSSLAIAEMVADTAEEAFGLA